MAQLPEILDRPTVISAGRSEREVAVDLRDRVRAKLGEACAIMDEANRAGMRVAFQVGTNGFGQNVVVSIEVMKNVA